MTTSRTPRPKGGAVLAALGLALAAAILPATTAHASPQPPGVDNQLTNPGGNPQPPQPPEPPDSGPDDEANPVDTPEPPQPPTPAPTPPAKDSMPTSQRVDAELGGAAVGSHHAAGRAWSAAPSSSPSC